MTNSKQTEAMKLALEALEAKGDAWIVLERKAKAAIREALAEQPAQQEPVAHCEAGPEHCPVCLAETRSLALAAAVGYVQRNTPKLVSEEICRALKSIPTTAREWVGLTEFDIDQISYSCSHADSRLIAYAIEAKLKEKNA